MNLQNIFSQYLRDAVQFFIVMVVLGVVFNVGISLAHAAGTIVIEKEVDNVAGIGETFSFVITNLATGTSTDFDVIGGDSYIISDLAISTSSLVIGTYSIVETDTNGWSLDSIICDQTVGQAGIWYGSATNADPLTIELNEEDNTFTCVSSSGIVSGNINGHVWYSNDADSIFDDNDEPQVNLEIIATNLSTNASSTAYTNSSGYYEFTDIPVGNYSLDFGGSSEGVSVTKDNTTETNHFSYKDSSVWKDETRVQLNATVINDNSGALNEDDISFLMVVEKTAQSDQNIPWDVSTTTMYSGREGWFPEHLSATLVAEPIYGYNMSVWSTAKGSHRECTDIGGGLATSTTAIIDQVLSCDITYDDLEEVSTSAWVWNDGDIDGLYEQGDDLLGSQEFNIYDSLWQLVDGQSIGSNDTDVDFSPYVGDYVCLITDGLQVQTGLSGNLSVVVDNESPNKNNEGSECHQITSINVKNADLGFGIYTPAILTIEKEVINDDGGTATVSDFRFTVTNASTSIATIVGHGDTVTLDEGDYIITESGPDGYIAGDWKGDCEVDGTISLKSGSDYICKITNNDEEKKGGSSSTRVNRNNTNSGSAAPKVLGASASKQCNMYLQDYLKMDLAEDNDFFQVLRLQYFLIKQGFGVSLTGEFDTKTDHAVHAFQTQYAEEVLKPWSDAGIIPAPSLSTGYVYQTTRWKINNLMCEGAEAFPDPLI